MLGGHDKRHGHRSVMGTWLYMYVLLECVVYSWAWEYKKLNDQPVRERVTDSVLHVH